MMDGTETHELDETELRQVTGAFPGETLFAIISEIMKATADMQRKFIVGSPF